jgi:hypothetical protein
MSSCVLAVTVALLAGVGFKKTCSADSFNPQTDTKTEIKNDSEEK